MQIYKTNLFTYNKQTNTFVAEASDLNVFGGQIHRMIGLQSHKTNKIIYCEYIRTHINDENEITHWEYHARRNDGGDLPQRGEPNFTVIIFND